MRNLLKKLLKPIIKELVQEELKAAKLTQISPLNDEALDAAAEAQILKVFNNINTNYATS